MCTVDGYLKKPISLSHLTGLTGVIFTTTI